MTILLSWDVIWKSPDFEQYPMRRVMLIRTAVDIRHFKPQTTVEQLLWKMFLEEPINIPLPNGGECEGLLVEINSYGSACIFELVVEIGDEYETLFYVNHNHNEYGIVHPN